MTLACCCLTSPNRTQWNLGELRGWQAKLRDGKEQGELLGRGRAYRHPSHTSFELLHEGPEPWSGEREEGCLPYLSLDHVDTSGTEGLHAVVNVYDALTLSHVQHHIQNDVATCATGARAGERVAQARSEPCRGSPGPRGRREEGAWGSWPCLPHTGDGVHRETPPQAGRSQGEGCWKSSGEMP